MKPLAGRCVLVTRPAERAGALIAMLEDAGAQVVSLPMQRIEPLAHALPDDAANDWWIFTSPAAVQHFRHDPAQHRTPRIAAIGRATADALAAEGLPADLVPDSDYSSEGLLASELMQPEAIAGMRVRIVTGQGGRGLLAQELARRGAQVQVTEVYRRVAERHAPERVAEALQRADSLVVTNGEALRELTDCCPEALRPRMRTLTLVAPSPRVVEMARSLGFAGDIRLPARMSDDAILEALTAATAEGSGPRMTQSSDVDPAHKADSELPDGETERASDAPPAPDREPASPEGQPPEPESTRGGGAGIAMLWLLLLLLAAAFGAAAWYGWQRLSVVEQGDAALREQLEQLSARIAERDARIAELSDQLADLAHGQAGMGLKLDEIEQRQIAADERLAQLATMIDSGRTELALAGIEQLLLLAAERAQLAADADGALRALRAADRRLAAIRDPRLVPVREAIAEEVAAIRAAEQPDRTALALAIGSLIRRAELLPLAAGAPERFSPPPSQPAEPPADAPPWRRVLSAVAEALKSMYAIRRDDKDLRQRLPEDARALAVELLRLKLEAARAALLRGEQQAYVAMLDAADAWLLEHFDTAHPAVQGARAQLAELRAEPIAPTLPQIGASLARLRAVLSAAAE